MSDTKRSLTSFLPEVLQTDVLKKFFAATGDHLFQPENVEFLNAYIGKRNTISGSADSYVSEQDANRVNYQVEATAVSRDPTTNTVTNVMVYADLLNKLRWQGAIVDDHSRLFEGEYYSFGVPFDIDKFVNYTNYVWLPQGPNTIYLLDAIDSSTIEGQKQFTYTGKYTLDSDRNQQLEGSIKFTSGLKVRFAGDADPNKRDIDVVVENVGRSILLVPDTIEKLAWNNPLEWNSTVWGQNTLYQTPFYTLIERGSPNQNTWSLRNRWFHKDILSISNTDVLKINSASARRPILEFDRYLEMWDSGTLGRGLVNLVDTTTTSLSQIMGQSSYKISDIELDDHMHVLFTNLSDPLANNRIYKVTNLRTSRQIVLEPVPRPNSTDTAPQAGDSIIQFQHNPAEASKFPGEEYFVHWYYTGKRWKIGQSWAPGVQTQAPLFQLYDAEGHSLSDSAFYPLSNFAGSTIFEYKQNSNGFVDPLLGFAPMQDSNQPSELLFENTLVSQQHTYQPQLVPLTIPGLKSWNILNGGSTLYNNWFTCATLSRQYVVNEYVTTSGQMEFEIDNEPSLDAPGLSAITVEVNNQHLKLNTDFVVDGTTVKMTNSVIANQFVKIRSWNQHFNNVKNGYFEIPLNLQANPINGEVTTTSRVSLLAHFEQIILNQSTVWRDSERDFSLGTKIVQHRASMLKLMGLNSVAQADVFGNSSALLDPMNVQLWANREYLRFYNKFINALINLYNGGSISGAQSADKWIERALALINVGKTSASTWANSGFEGAPGANLVQPSVSPTYVPTDPSRLGVTPVYRPLAFFDNSQPNSPLSLLLHNGGVVVLKDLDNNVMGTISNNQSQTNNPLELTHPVAQAWMQFEVKLYNSIPDQLKNAEAQLAVDPRTIFSNKWRKTRWTWADQQKLLRPIFDRWTTNNQIDAFRNTSFDLNDPFSWNYASCVDRDGESIPGNWRGIYFYYYDTDRPHLAPWEMLGYSQKPQWWDSEYGSAPYTRGNLKMWQDLRDGKIRQGPRQGIDVNWARPNLLDCIPVDEFGSLLPPFQANIVNGEPSVNQARSDWKFGDRSPLENVWLTTVDCSFIHSQISYLTKPAQFVEYLWDPTRSIEIFEDQPNRQWVNRDSLNRPQLKSLVVHRENPSTISSISDTSEYFGSAGIQQWISEYLISDNRSVTTYFGNLIRGLGVNLSWRVGGFTDINIARLLVDSFGLSTNDSLLLPQEDASALLYRSASTKEFFYSGVIVEYQGNLGWRVIGYDSVNPFFSIIPSRKTGPRSTVIIDRQKVLEYQQGTGQVEKVPYGTVFSTRQDVYDFLISLGRWQESQGWKFEDFNPVNNSLMNWSMSAKEFLFWSQGPWAAGTFIALSPLATRASFSTDQGMIQNVSSVVNGTYAMLDRGGRNISLRDVDFLRLDNNISVRPFNDQGIFGLRLFTTTVEHILIFNNLTLFGDVIYDPIVNIRQDRFKILAPRTLNWQGRMEAPGYLVAQTQTFVGDQTIVNNRVIPNFEKSISDINAMYEIDVPSSYKVGESVQQSRLAQSSAPVNQKLARHLVGYQPRSYLTNLLVDDKVQFQFYQGMIQQKGTASSIDKLLRNTTILSSTESFDYFEEFAFRTGEYGATDVFQGIDIQLRQNLFFSNPQIVEILGSEDWDNPGDNTVTIVPGSRDILSSTSTVSPWTMRSHYGPAPNDLPTAGYVIEEEVDYIVKDDRELTALWATLLATTPLEVGDRVWKFIDTTRVWNVYKVCDPGWTILSSAPNGVYYTTITTTLPHQLKSGALVVVQNLITSQEVISGTYAIFNVTETTFDILATSTSPGSDGSVWIYFSTRFHNQTELNTAVVPNGWGQGDLVYVDGDSQTPWSVYVSQGTWILKRREQRKVDISLMRDSFLYDTVSQASVAQLTLWDPIKGAVPAVVAQEIDYRTPYDPAKYNTAGFANIVDPQLSWGPTQVGTTWWDLSTTRFLDYETGTNSQRRQNWGQLAPGTTIDIYEWVRSTVPPASWAGPVGANATGTGGVGGVSPGSTQGTDVNYVERMETVEGGSVQPFYYFWVKGSQNVPSVAGRTQSTANLSQIISQPQNLNLAWWAPIDSTTALLGNIEHYLNHNQTAWSINWLTHPNATGIHKQWTLMRPNDPRSFPTSQLWNKMRDSLLEMDADGNPVPNLYVNNAAARGTRTRFNQSWFDNPPSARRAFVTKVNSLLAASTTPPRFDVERTNWQEYLNSAEPIPPQNNRLMPVKLASTVNLDAIYRNQDDGQGATLESRLFETLVLDGVNHTLSPGDRVLIKNQKTQSYKLSQQQLSQYSRDVALVLGCVINDILSSSLPTTSYPNSVAMGNILWAKDHQVPQQVQLKVNSWKFGLDMLNQIVNNQRINTRWSTLPTQIVDPRYANGGDVFADIRGGINTIVDIYENGPSVDPVNPSVIAAGQQSAQNLMYLNFDFLLHEALSYATANYPGTVVDYEDFLRHLTVVLVFALNDTMGDIGINCQLAINRYFGLNQSILSPAFKTTLSASIDYLSKLVADVVSNKRVQVVYQNSYPQKINSSFLEGQNFKNQIVDNLQSIISGINNAPIAIVTDPSAVSAVNLIVDNMQLIRNQMLTYVVVHSPDYSLSDASQNGIYSVVSPGSATSSWKLKRSVDYCKWDQMIPADVLVLGGSTQAQTTWKQTNANILHVGRDAVNWQSGALAPQWVKSVVSLSERDSLSYQISFGSCVLVHPNSLTNNKWTIWQWTQSQDSSGTNIDEWVLVRAQSYVTPNCWSYVDWYAAGYSSSSVPKHTWNTLRERDKYKKYQNGDLIKVNNVGDGTWSWYQYSTTNSLAFTLVAKQNGGIQLSDNLWDYQTYNLGWDGSSYAQELVGWDGDTRLELEQIIQAIWPDKQGKTGLLKADASSNEYNQLFFEMIYHVLGEQKFVDWIFKTSFVNLRGFGQSLSTTNRYQPSNIENLLNYINEVKPYRAKVREFVDYRTTLDTWYGSVTDSDRPPYVLNDEIRILDAAKAKDLYVLETNKEYNSWYTNHKTNPSLIRNIRTQLVLDRIHGMRLQGTQLNGVVSVPSPAPVVILDQGTIENVRGKGPWTVDIVGLHHTWGFVPGGTITVNNNYFDNSQPIPTSGSLGVLNTGTIVDVSAHSLTVTVTDAEPTPGLVFDISLQIEPENNLYIAVLEVDPSHMFVPGSVFVAEEDKGNLGRGGIQMVVRTTPSHVTYVSIGGVAPAPGSVVNIRFPIIETETGVIENVQGTGPWTGTISQLSSTLGFVPGSHISAVSVEGSLGSTNLVRIERVSSHSLEFVCVGTSAPVEGSILNISYRPQQHGAADRILRDYHPTGDTMPIDDPLLISGMAGKLQQLDGMGLSNQAAWNQTPWSSWQPWNQTSDNFERFFDITVEGGTPPEFYRYQGDGNTTLFALPLAPQDPARMRVWVNGQLKSFGQDWDIPNYISNVHILSPGIGYRVNDRVTLPHPLSERPAQIQILNISPIGEILSIKILDNGSYQTSPGLNQLDADGGSGENAIFAISWGGTSLVFASAPPAPTNVDDFNVWALPAGNTMTPAPSDFLGTVFDGAGLARPWYEPNHPEEFVPLRNRDALRIKVFQARTPGISNVLTESFPSDDITDQFPIGQFVDTNSTIIVSHNGVEANLGVDQDYVINYETQHVVFVTPPAQGTVNIVSIDGAVPSLTTDNLAGNATNKYSLSQLPSGSSSVIVKVNSKTINPYWDYQVDLTDPLNPFVQILNLDLDSGDTVDIVYPTAQVALPGVAVEYWHDIYSDPNVSNGWFSAEDLHSETRRLSNRLSTTLSKNCAYNDSEIWVSDHRNLDRPSSGSPGVIWIDSERIEYYQIQNQPTSQLPFQARLTHLIRRSQGTSGGVSDKFSTQFFSGTDTVRFFVQQLVGATGWDTVTHVVVDGIEQEPYKDYKISLNPPRQQPGVYLEFVKAPPKGVKNIQLSIVNRDWFSSTTSHFAGTRARVGGASQKIPGRMGWHTYNVVTEVVDSSTIKYQAIGGTSPTEGTVGLVMVPLSPTGLLTHIRQKSDGSYKARIERMATTALVQVGSSISAQTLEPLGTVSEWTVSSIVDAHTLEIVGVPPVEEDTIPPTPGKLVQIFTPISSGGTVESIEGTGPWTATLSNLDDTGFLSVGSIFSAVSDSGAVQSNSWHYSYLYQTRFLLNEPGSNIS